VPCSTETVLLSHMQHRETTVLLLCISTHAAQVLLYYYSAQAHVAHAQAHAHATTRHATTRHEFNTNLMTVLLNADAPCSFYVGTEVRRLSFFLVLDLLVYVSSFFSSTWLSPLLSFISSKRASLSPFLFINLQFVFNLAIKRSCLDLCNMPSKNCTPTCM